MPPDLERLRKLTESGDPDATGLYLKEAIRGDFEDEIDLRILRLADPELLAIMTETRLYAIDESERPKIEEALNLVSNENDGHSARVNELTTSGLLNPQKGDIPPPSQEYCRYALFKDLKENPEKAEVISRMKDPVVLLMPEKASCERVLEAYDNCRPEDFSKGKRYVTDYLRKTLKQENEANRVQEGTPIIDWKLVIIDGANNPGQLPAYRHDLDGSDAPRDPIHLDDLQTPLQERIAAIRPWQKKMKSTPVGPKESILLQLRGLFKTPPRPVDYWDKDRAEEDQDRTWTIQTKHYKEGDSLVTGARWKSHARRLTFDGLPADYQFPRARLRASVTVSL